MHLTHMHAYKMNKETCKVLTICSLVEVIQSTPAFTALRAPRIMLCDGLGVHLTHIFPAYICYPFCFDPLVLW